MVPRLARTRDDKVGRKTEQTSSLRGVFLIIKAIHMIKTTFTSESVCAGHPDKICDQISDAILDAAISVDKHSHVGVEAMVGKDFVALVGELKTKAKLDFKKITKNVIKKLGYTDPELKFTFNSPITVKVHTQSPEIAVGVDDEGAGDQGMMFGFACSDTKNYMPLPISIAHRLVMKVDEIRINKKLDYLRPDGKSQVTVGYNKFKPVSVEQIVMAVPHLKSVSISTVKNDIFNYVVKPVLNEFGYKITLKEFMFNGTGVWDFSGPAADSGVTGRKIVVDSYGGMCHVGGGCFSGKDPTKVDRSGAYAARYLAKNIVACGLADRCEVRLAYFIGARKPVMQQIETFGTGKKSFKVINSLMTKLLDTSVKGIIDKFDLLRPIYFNTAAYGHFGRDEFPWEKIVS